MGFPGFKIDVAGAIASGLESAREYRERNPITKPAEPKKPLARQVKLEQMAGFIYSRLHAIAWGNGGPHRAPLDQQNAFRKWYTDWLENLQREAK